MILGNYRSFLDRANHYGLYSLSLWMLTSISSWLYVDWGVGNPLFLLYFGSLLVIATHYIYFLQQDYRPTLLARLLGTGLTCSLLFAYLLLLLKFFEGYGV